MFKVYISLRLVASRWANAASDYCDFEFKPALTAASTGLRQPIVSSAASLSASRMRKDPGGVCLIS